MSLATLKQNNAGVNVIEELQCRLMAFSHKTDKNGNPFASYKLDDGSAQEWASHFQRADEAYFQPLGMTHKGQLFTFTVWANKGYLNCQPLFVPQAPPSAPQTPQNAPQAANSPPPAPQYPPSGWQQTQPYPTPKDESIARQTAAKCIAPLYQGGGDGLVGALIEQSAQLAKWMLTGEEPTFPAPQPQDDSAPF